jgi:hypothetical protein
VGRAHGAFFGLTARLEPFQPELADGLQHLETRLVGWPGALP